MTVFAILETTENQALGERIQHEYPLDHVKVAVGQWLVSDVGNAKTVSDRLGITGDANVRGTMILSISSYYGRHNTEIWEWIKSKMEASS